MYFQSITRLFIGLFIFSLVACTGNKSDEAVDQNEDVTQQQADESQNEPKPQPVAGSLSGDTLNISGKFVVFFGPVETNSKPAKITPSDLVNFKAASAALIDSLSSKTDIKTAYTTAGFFRIYTSNGNMMVITKSALNEDAGMLLNDGSQPPVIKKGVFSTDEYYQKIKEFFFFK